MMNSTTPLHASGATSQGRAWNNRKTQADSSNATPSITSRAADIRVGNHREERPREEWEGGEGRTGRRGVLRLFDGLSSSP